MKINILGAHNQESRDTALSCLLVDDILALDVGSLTRSLTLVEQKRLKAVLLTHHHFDHIRDIPTLGMNFRSFQATIDVYATQVTAEALTTYLLDGELYINFLEIPEENPTVRLNVFEPNQEFEAAGYDVLPLEVPHAKPAVGFHVTSPDGKSLFYTGDTGPGLEDCWQKVTPDILIVEVTIPNEFAEVVREAGHLTSELLRQELESFRRIQGYLPPIVAVHLNPDMENEIAAELAAVSRAMDTPITLGHEGMLLEV